MLGNAPGVWHRDANIKDPSGYVTLTNDESKDIMDAIGEADKHSKPIDPKTFDFLEKGTELLGEKYFYPN